MAATLGSSNGMENRFSVQEIPFQWEHNRQHFFLNMLEMKVKPDEVPETGLEGQNFFLTALHLAHPQTQLHYQKKIQTNYLNAYINREYTQFHTRRVWLSDNQNNAAESVQRDRQAIEGHAEKFTSIMEGYKTLLEKNTLVNADVRIMRRVDHDLDRASRALKLYIARKGLQPEAQRWLVSIQGSSKYRALQWYFEHGGKGVPALRDHPHADNRMQGVTRLSDGVRSSGQDTPPGYSPQPRNGETSIPIEDTMWDSAPPYAFYTAYPPTYGE